MNKKKKLVRLDRFILNYQGNKYRETKKYLSGLNISKYDYICEPYGGIFGFSRVMFEINPDFKGVFLINDTDKELIEFYKKLKNNLEKTVDFYAKKINDLITQAGNIDKNFTPLIRDQPDRILRFLCRGHNSCIFNIKKSQTKLKNFKEKLTEYKLFFDKCLFYNLKSCEFFEMVDQYKNKLIFCDPPYFNSSNNSYFSEPILMDGTLIEYPDNTSMYVHIKQQFDKKKEDMIFIMNFTALIHYIFLDYFKKKYSKTYGNNLKNKGIIGKTKADHVLYCSGNVEFLE